jgi:hypothetical protein
MREVVIFDHLDLADVVGDQLIRVGYEDVITDVGPNSVLGRSVGH